MDRPASIRRFEFFYAAHILLGLLGNLLTLVIFPSETMAHQLSGLGTMAQPAALGVIGVTLLTQALIWFLIARRGSHTARTGLAGLTGLNLLGLALAVLRLAAGGARLDPLPFLLSAGSSACLTAALLLLFRADTQRWFATEADE